MSNQNLLTRSVENDGTATATEARVGDVITTIISTDAAVVGMHGLAQRAILFAGGMAAQSYRKTGSLNFLA